MKQNLYIQKIGINAKIAFKDLSNISEKKRNSVLKQFCKYLQQNKKLILKANKKDLLKAKKNKSNMLDRLKLDNKKINQIIKSVKDIIKFSDPVGKILDSWKRPNGLIVKKNFYTYWSYRSNLRK